MLHGLALCAGVGGLELGLRLVLREHYRCVGYVERDAYAAAVLVARMDEATLDRAPVWDDLATFAGGAWRGAVDLVSAGFPCPPYSSAGKKLGVDDGRDLWPDVTRVVREVEPELVFLENVRGSAGHGDGLRRWLGDLARLGFDAEWGVFTAAGDGAPHERARLYVLAWRVPDALRGALRHVAERGAGAARSADAGNAEPRDVGEEVADADLGRLEGERLEECAGLEGEPRDEPDGRGADRRLGWPPGPDGDFERGDPVFWPTTEPGLRRVADGLPGRLDASWWSDRLRCLGNGVVPQTAARAFLTLAERAVLGSKA